MNTLGLIVYLGYDNAYKFIAMDSVTSIVHHDGKGFAVHYGKGAMSCEDKGLDYDEVIPKTYGEFLEMVRK